MALRPPGRFRRSACRAFHRRCWRRCSAWCRRPRLAPSRCSPAPRRGWPASSPAQCCARTSKQRWCSLVHRGLMGNTTRASVNIYKNLKCDCHNFWISPAFHVFMRRQYYILPHGEVFMWNCVFSLYLAFFPGGWTLESQTSQWSKHQICDVIESNSSLTPPPLPFNYICGCGFS